MNIWGFLKNIKKFINFFNILKRLITAMASGKRMPECSEAKELFDAVEELLDSGAIDIPGVDEAAISQALKDIEAQWTCKV